jgi:hypothetical protein
MHCPTVASALRCFRLQSRLIGCVASFALVVGFAVPSYVWADDAGPAAPAKDSVSPPAVPAVTSTVSSPTAEAKAAAPASTKGQTADDIPTLIAKLGNDLFTVRESASNQLAKQGIAARSQLQAALESPDAEVRFRARRILAVVVEADFQRRLSAFSADVDGKLNLSMPGWTAFKRLVGSDQAARDVFVEMQQANAPLLEAYEQGPKQGAEKLRALAAAEPTVNIGRGRTIVQPTVSNLGAILSWLFVASDPDVQLSDDITSYAMQLPNNRVFQEAALPNSRDASSQREVCRKILGHWVARDDLNSALVMSNLSYAATFDLKEGVVPAVSILKQPQSPTNMKSSALLVLAKFGGKEQLPLVEPLLQDHELCFGNQFMGAANQPMTPANQITPVQLSDVALFTTILLSDQDPKKFGFVRFHSAQRELLNPNSAAFASDKDREGAFQKWQEWQAGQRQAMGEKPAMKSGAEKTE